jgi:preprotein translocase SecE subunit
MSKSLDIVRRHSRIVGLFTLISALIMAWVFRLAIKSLMASTWVPAGLNRELFLGARVSDVVGVALALVLFLVCMASVTYRRFSSEVVNEIVQCVFPNREEAMSDTTVVVVVSVILGVVLWLFDTLSASFTGMLYNAL